MEFPELPATPRTRLFTSAILDAGLERFEREGLWLLLSIHHYGWRAHADMAALLVSDEDPLALGEHHREHRAMAALEELFLLLDQLWRLVSGIRAHRAGEGFLAGYRRYGADVAAEFEALRELTRDEWREIFGLPGDDQLPALVARRGAGDDVDTARLLLDDVLETTVRNMDEVSVFFVRTDVGGLRGRSLRDVNNAYRHGTQVVYEDTSPEVIPWRAPQPDQTEGMLLPAAEIDEFARQETVSVLLEGPDEEGHARFASLSRSREMNDSLVESMRNASILLWRLATSFLVTELRGGPILSAMAPFTWEQLDTRFREDEQALGH
jgi:hypothetical protein